MVGRQYWGLDPRRWRCILADAVLNKAKRTSFWAGYDHWFPKIALHLSPKHMEHVGRSCRIDEREISIVDILKKLIIFKPKRGRGRFIALKIQIAQTAV